MLPACLADNSGAGSWDFICTPENTSATANCTLEFGTHRKQADSALLQSAPLAILQRKGPARSLAVCANTCEECFSYTLTPVTGSCRPQENAFASLGYCRKNRARERPANPDKAGAAMDVLCGIVGGTSSHSLGGLHSTVSIIEPMQTTLCVSE